jgi:hypothetical protein
MARGTRWRATTGDGGGRRRAVATTTVRHGIMLGGSVSCADCTGVKRVRRQTHLGRRGWLGCGEDGAWHGGAAALLRQATHDNLGHGDDHKRHRGAPHLLAQLRDGFTTAEQLRR